jgi:hypothetical protein
MTKIIFCVTSTINTSKEPWSYIPLRSFYTGDERLDQTITQLKSIREYCPQAQIIFVEGSRLYHDQYLQLKEYADIILETTNDMVIQDAIHKSKYKGLGECYLLKKGFDYVIENNIPVDLFFKIGGRISLNNQFNIENHTLNKMNFKKITGVDEPGYNTVLYSIPRVFLKQFNQLQDTVIARIPSLIGIEYIYPSVYHAPINYLTVLGVEGTMGIDGNYFSI